jgi:hypothetical protein
MVAFAGWLKKQCILLECGRLILMLNFVGG